MPSCHLSNNVYLDFTLDTYIYILLENVIYSVRGIWLHFVEFQLPFLKITRININISYQGKKSLPAESDNLCFFILTSSEVPTGFIENIKERL